MRQHCLNLGLLVSLLLGIGSPGPVLGAIDQGGRVSYESALQFFEKGRSLIAVKQLKSVLEANPGDLPARVLLGEVYLSLGYAAAAETQLREALRGGASLSTVVVTLARSLYEQRKYKELIDEFHAVGHRPEIRSELLVLRGLSRLSMRDVDAAEKAFNEALRISPTEAAPYIGRAQLNLSQGRLDRAEADIRIATELDPQRTEGWYTFGIISVFKGDRRQALEALSKAIELVPQNMPARAARASINVNSGNIEAARSDVEFVLSNTPDDAQAGYLHARILQHDGNIAGARAALDAASATLAALPPEVIRTDAQLLLLAAHINLALENFEIAFGYLKTLVARFPHHLGGRQVLARLHIKRGELGPAYELLEPVFARNAVSPRVLETQATLLLGLKRYEEALKVLETLHRERPDDVPLMMKYARALSHTGKRAESLALVRRVLELQPEHTVAAMTLGSDAMRRKDVDTALQMAQLILKAKPDAVAGYNLMGTAYVVAGDVAQARMAFERGLQSTPGHVATSHNLAKLFLREGDLDAAIRTYQAVLEVNTGSLSTMMQLAPVLERNGNAAEAVRVLSRARGIAGDDLTPALALIDLFIRMDDLKAARTVLQELESSKREDLAVMEARGRIDMLNGELYKARATYEKMSRLAGFNAPVLRRIARLQQGVKDLEGARYSLQKAIQGNASDLNALAELVLLDLKRGAPAQARQSLLKIENIAGESPNYAALRGEVLMSEGRYEAAARAFDQSARRSGRMTTKIMTRQFQALKQAGLDERAAELMGRWLQARPRDVTARLVDASTRLREGDVEGAIRGFDAILEVAPDNVLALNNLASILRDRDPERALKLANSAYERAPESAPVLDTLGWVLTQHQQFESALKLLRSAEARAGVRPEISYHLAVALDGAGRREAAVRALQSAVSSSEDFLGKAEAKALLSSWN